MQSSGELRCGIAEVCLSASRPCGRRDPYGEDSRLNAAEEVFFTFEARGYGSLRSQGRPAEGDVTGAQMPCCSEIRSRETRCRLLFSRGLRRLQSEFLLDRFAHQKLLDLAGDRHRKLIDEFDITRDLVVCDLPLTEVADLISGEGFAAPCPDPGAELFAM